MRVAAQLVSPHLLNQELLDVGAEVRLVLLVQLYGVLGGCSLEVIR